MLLRLAEAGLYRPLWSTTILAEAERTLIHLHPEIPSATLHHRLSAMGQFFPDATVTGWDDLVNSLTLPDPDDRHVLAAAIVGGADAIVTANRWRPRTGSRCVALRFEVWPCPHPITE